MRQASVLFALIIVSFSEEQCPNPDDNSDIADETGSGYTRPPAGISEFNVTAVGAYNLNVSWNTPVFHFTTEVQTQICHFYLNISYEPPQKGSHHRTTHMNCDNYMRSAPITDLTPDTIVTIQLRTCLLVPPNGTKQGFICTLPVEIVQRTAANPDTCPYGYFNNTENICSPCLCNNKTKLCQIKTGKCLDCLEGSHGEHCEKCVTGYTHNGDRCEPLSHISITSKPPPSNTDSTAIESTPIHVSKHETTTSAPCVPPGSSDGIDGTPPVIKSVPVTIIVTSVLVAVAIISCVIILVYKKCGGCRKKPVQFWTIQLQADNQPTVAYSDIADPQLCREDRNRLIDNDITARLAAQQLMSDENPYRPVTA